MRIGWRLFQFSKRRWLAKRPAREIKSALVQCSFEPSIAARMPNGHRNRDFLPAEEIIFAARKRKSAPHEFVLDALASLGPRTHHMFGCLAVYVEEQIVLILRDRPTHTGDNGVWLATVKEHHASLQREFPSMRSIRLLGRKITGWQVLPADAPDFEEAALRACELIVARDPRIGKVPGARRARASRAKAARKKRAAPRARRRG
jgi:hypothetical protein